METADWIKAAAAGVVLVAGSTGATLTQTGDKADEAIVEDLEHRFEDAALSNCEADNRIATKIREIILIAPMDPDIGERERDEFLREAFSRFEFRDCEALVRGDEHVR